MKKIGKVYLNLMDHVNTIIGYLLALSLFFTTMITFWQVVSRFIGSSLSWSEELTRFLMIFMIMLGAAIAHRKNKLISVEIVVEQLKGWMKEISFYLMHLFSIVFFIVLIVYGMNLASNFTNQIAPGTGISMKYIYMSLPIGGGLMLLNSLASLIEHWMKGDETSC